jgi:hypothetical protein
MEDNSKPKEEVEKINIRNAFGNLLFLVFFIMLLLPTNNSLISLVGFTGSLSTILFAFVKPNS